MSSRTDAKSALDGSSSRCWLWLRSIIYACELHHPAACRAGAEGEGEMTDNDVSSAGPDPHINFDAPAVLRKWPSLNNQRRSDGTGPYFLLGGTLDECIREFMAKPAPIRHLYEIHTSPQPPLIADVLSGEIVAELARLREFL